MQKRGEGREENKGDSEERVRRCGEAGIETTASEKNTERAH